MTIVWAKKTHPVLVARHCQPVLGMLDFCQQPNIFSWYTFLSVLEELVYCQRFLSHVHSAIFTGFLLFRAKSPPFDFFSSAYITNSTYVMRQISTHSQQPQPGLNMTPLNSTMIDIPDKVILSQEIRILKEKKLQFWKKKLQF